ncbi:MAG: 30S ribosomal protein S1 [bacterium]|nr:30S ribosomal protein S1 [bacterium]
MTENVPENPSVQPTNIDSISILKKKKSKTILAPEIEEHTPQEVEYYSQLIDRTATEMKVGSIVKVLVSGKSEKEITVSTNFKSDVSIPIEEFDNISELKIGDEIEVLFDYIDEETSQPVLSKRKAIKLRAWENLRSKYEQGEIVKGKVIKRIKGGLIVDIEGVEAFLPGSQIDVHPVRDFDMYLGKTMDFRIIKINEQRQNAVVSRKVLVEENLSERRTEILDTLHKLIHEEGRQDVVLEGTVKNITDFGVFVDLGGVDGLLHITDLSWGRVDHPSQVVSMDQKIKVKVLSYDPEKRRISLGLKQLQENYWESIESKYPVGSKVKGKVSLIKSYGAFVELEPGVEGLVHVSEMSWTQHIKHPSQMVQPGDEVEVVVLKVDTVNRKISLGMKQVNPDPWQNIEEKYPINSKQTGVVRDIMPYGAFVELEPEIDGLVHISDLSWTKKVKHPSDILKKGDKIEVMIVSIDKAERRIGLSLKRLESNPWDIFADRFPIKSRTVAQVQRLNEKGVVVTLPYGIEGFIPNSLLSRTADGPKRKNLKPDDLVIVEVTEFERENRKVILTAIDFAKDMTMPSDDDFPMPLPTGATIADILEENKKENH